MKPMNNFYEFVGRSPAANEYELDFARALITGEKLGTHATTDMLTLSLSANDVLGHAVGPDAAAQHQMVDSLDTDLDSFFTWLDKNVDGGLGNVWIALTADHGVAPVLGEAAKLGINAASISTKKIVAQLNQAMNAKFSPGQNVVYLFDQQELPYLALNPPSFERAGINEGQAEDAVLTALPAAVESLSKPQETATPSQTRLPPTPVLIHAYTRLQLAAGQYPTSEFGQILAHSYSSNGGWYVMTVFADYQMEGHSSGGTTHFSPWSYDRHVPLGFYGAPFAPGIYRGRVGPVDLAATLGRAARHQSALGLDRPHPHPGAQASSGRHLSQVRIGNQTVKPNMAVSFAGIELRNPVIAASGTFGYGIEFEDIVSLDRIGGLVTKGLSREPMAGNPAPRIIETASGMLNAIGLQNIGVEAFIRDKLPQLAKYPGCAVIANVFGNEVKDYVAVIEALNQAEGIAAYEINASCPNTKHGGQVFGTDMVELATLVYATKQAALQRAKDEAKARPIIVKLSPNVTSIAEMASVAEQAGADAISLINTLLAMAIDAKTRTPPHRQRHRRIIRPRHQTHRPAHGLRSLARGEDSRPRIRRHRHRRRRRRIPPRRSHRHPGRHRQLRRPPRHRTPRQRLGAMVREARCRESREPDWCARNLTVAYLTELWVPHSSPLLA